MAECNFCGGQCGNGCGTGCSGSCELGCRGHCGNGCGDSCGTGCSQNCSGSCYESCTGGCGAGCASTCTGSCSGCSGGCKDSCATIASLQLGGNEKIDWENFSSGETIVIKAEEWNNVAEGFKNYIKSAEHNSFPSGESVEIDTVSYDDPITAELYNQLFYVLNGNVPTSFQLELNELAVENSDGDIVGAIADKTIITAKHFSVIGEIFNSWPVPQD